ncbi:MAG: hypothetical protein IMW89_12750 [Ktedonobacteraceae bacterium]|nr:hypothetical protein [Ktedonobacteraceae bacterium]
MPNDPQTFSAKTDSSVDETLLIRAKAHIDDLARKMAGGKLSDEEIKDLAQSSLVKFWRYALVQEIRSLRAYLKKIVHSELVTIQRQRHEQPFADWLAADESEIDVPQGKPLIYASEGMGDPAEEVERQMASQELMQQVVEAMKSLSQRQCTAMACRLWEKLDDLVPFVDELHMQSLAVETLWPDERAEKQRLQASCSPARQHIARYIGISLEGYKQRKRYQSF